jgi:hypothetical protein
MATCPACLQPFSTAGKTAPRRPAAAREEDDDEEGTESKVAWINPYGAVAVALAALALSSASLVGVRLVTIMLASLGLLVVALGLVVGKGRERKDRMWFALGGALNVLVLLIMLFSPGWLNSFWGLNVDANEPNAQQMVAVPRKQPSVPGKLLTANDWVDAGDDAIRQGKVLVRIEAVKSGSRNGIPCLQVHLRITNSEAEELTIAGFGGDKPVLTDGSGRSYAFHKPQKRIYAEGPPRFEDMVEQSFQLKVDNTQDYQLLFDMPSDVNLLKLEVPASAWGREGRCQFDITNLNRK